jgi:hypothetical protein
VDLRAKQTADHGANQQIDHKVGVYSALSELPVGHDSCGYEGKSHHQSERMNVEPAYVEQLWIHAAIISCPG